MAERAGELLAGIDVVSSRPVRRIVLWGCPPSAVILILVVLH